MLHNFIRINQVNTHHFDYLDDIDFAPNDDVNVALDQHYVDDVAIYAAAIAWCNDIAERMWLAARGI